MNEGFDQLAKGVAQSVTRRQALKRFGFGLAGIALAAFATSAKAEDSCIPTGHSAGELGRHCDECCSGFCANEGNDHFVCT